MAGASLISGIFTHPVPIISLVIQAFMIQSLCGVIHGSLPADLPLGHSVHLGVLVWALRCRGMALIFAAGVANGVIVRA